LADAYFISVMYELAHYPNDKFVFYRDKIEKLYFNNRLAIPHTYPQQYYRDRLRDGDFDIEFLFI